MERNSQAEEVFGSIGEAKVTLYPEETERSFSSFDEFRSFLESEVSFWSECTAGHANTIRARFDKFVKQLNGFSASYDENALRGVIEAANVKKFPCVYSTTFYAKIIKALYSKQVKQADAACEVLFPDSPQPEISKFNREYLKGVVTAITMANQGTMTPLEIEVQRTSLSDLRERFSKELQTLHSEYLAKKEYIEESYTVLKSEFAKTREQFESFLTEKTTTMRELEKLYAERLRFDSPAHYWDRMAVKYKSAGKRWRTRVVILAAVLIAYLTCMLYKFPPAWQESELFSLASIKSTIVFALIVSTGLYLMSLFIKLSLSAYHLSRDAKERLQLTHVYLSLLNESAVSEAERGIVLEAIFSRADTGLLKGDSSPTLPDGLLTQVLRALGKK